MKKRCFIYVRVSTRIQAEEGFSIPEQLERLNKYADAMDWLVAQVFVDPGHSGSTLDRPGIQELISRVSEADVVLVDKLDRLSRSLNDTLWLISKVFAPNNVSFVSRAESFDTTSSFGRAALGIMAVFAELEREKIKERTHDGMMGRAKAGYWHGSPPFGYDKDKATGLLEKNEYDVAQYREIIDLVLQRLPLLDVVNILTQKGYSLHGKPWTVNTLRRILASRAQLGEVQFSGEWYPGLHEPIKSPDEHNAIVQILHERSRQNERFMPGKKYAAPLAGITWCKQCGAKYHYRLACSSRSTEDGQKRSYRSAYYSCYSRSKCNRVLVRDPNCQNPHWRDKDLESVVYEQILALKHTPAMIDDIRRSTNTQQKRDALSSRIAQLSAQIDRLMDLYSIGTIPIDSISSRIEPLTIEKNGLQAQLNELNAEQALMSTNEIIALVGTFEKILASGSPQEIHLAIISIIDYIELDNNIVSIHWRF